jgi:hypothetical protein
MSQMRETRPLDDGRASGCSLLGGENTPRDSRNPAPNQLRLRLLAAKIHGLGPVALGYLFDELARGRDVMMAAEEYARLEPLADFIREHAVRPGPFLIAGGAP